MSAHGRYYTVTYALGMIKREVDDLFRILRQVVLDIANAPSEETSRNSRSTGRRGALTTFSV